MGQIVRDIKALLLGDDVDVPDADWNHLWDELGEPVAGGTNWAAADKSWDDDSLVGITGPDLPETELPF